MHPPRYQSLTERLRVLKAQRWVVALVAVVSTLVALGLSIRQSEVYLATSTLAFEDPAEDLRLIDAPVVPTVTPGRRALIGAQFVTRPVIAERVREELDLSISAAALQDMLTTEVERGTSFVKLNIRAGEARLAASIANVYAREGGSAFTVRERERFAAAARELRRRLGALSASAEDPQIRAIYADRISRLESLAQFAQPVRIARFAATPKVPESPRPIRNTVFGLCVGLLVGVGLAFLRDGLDRRLRGLSDIREHLNLPVLGHVREGVLGYTTVPSDNGQAALSDQDFEAFRILRMNLEFLDLDETLGSIVVTSAVPEEGKSTVALSLAFASVAAGRRTLLLECDLRRPTLAARLGLERAPGLTDYLIGRAQPRDVVQTAALPPIDGLNASSNGDSTGTSASPEGEQPRDASAMDEDREGQDLSEPGAASGEAEPALALGSAHLRLSCITAGSQTPQPAELLGSARFTKFLEEVTAVYDVVVLDTCPLLSVVDTLELLPHVDGAIFCVRASRTTRDEVVAAREALAHFEDRPLGVVLTGMRAGHEQDYGYYSYAYSYAYRSASSPE